jgi:uncharacterized protein
MKFEWDENKNKANILKHGISFELAASIFASEYISSPDIRKEYGEVRNINIGKAINELIVVAITTDRKKVIRIISARKANKDERRIYYEKTKSR